LILWFEFVARKHPERVSCQWLSPPSYKALL